MAVGVVEACQSQGRSEVLIAGFYGIQEGLKCIKEGTMVCSLYLDAKERIGKGGVELALAILEG